MRSLLEQLLHVDGFRGADMKEILYVGLVIGVAFVVSSLLNMSQYVIHEMQERIIDANIEAEERGYEVRMQRERTLRR